MKKSLSSLVQSVRSLFAPRRTPHEDLFDRQVSIGSHSLHVFCLGRGSPAVVIDTGFGETCAAWEPLQRQIARWTQAFAYDRAGYAESSPGPLPRHSRMAAEDLHLLLEKAGLTPPYVLLGHSLGALNLQVFASLYPSDTAGMVLLDPPPLGWINGEGFPELATLARQETENLKDAARQAALSADPAEHAKTAFYAMLVSEHGELLGSSARQAADITSFGSLPLVVLASTRPNPKFSMSAEAFQQYWIEQSRALAAKSTRGSFVLAQDSSHHIHLDAPKLVLDAVRRVGTL